VPYPSRGGQGAHDHNQREPPRGHEACTDLQHDMRHRGSGRIMIGFVLIFKRVARQLSPLA